jgi:hypothetical protein
MKNSIHLILTLLIASLAVLNAAEERSSQPYDQLVQQRLGAATCAGRPYAEQVDSQLTNALNQITHSEKALNIVNRNSSFKPDLALLLFPSIRTSKRPTSWCWSSVRRIARNTPARGCFAFT